MGIFRCMEGPGTLQIDRGDVVVMHIDTPRHFDGDS